MASGKHTQNHGYMVMPVVANSPGVQHKTPPPAFVVRTGGVNGDGDTGILAFAHLRQHPSLFRPVFN